MKMFKIEHPLTGVKFHVATQDFPKEMNWKEAMKACSDSGSIWRLPTQNELIIMYEQLNKKGLGDFKNGIYWSSSEYPNPSFAWVLDFNNGNSNYFIKKILTANVRVVCDFI